MNVPYWLQLAIWPLIRDTSCYYCIFIRGMGVGTIIGVVITGGVWWARS